MILKHSSVLLTWPWSQHLHPKSDDSNDKLNKKYIHPFTPGNMEETAYWSYNLGQKCYAYTWIIILPLVVQGCCFSPERSEEIAPVLSLPVAPFPSWQSHVCNHKRSPEELQLSCTGERYYKETWSICKRDTKSKVVLIVKSSFYSFQQWEMMLFHIISCQLT